MQKLIAVSVLLLIATSVQAREVAGVDVPETTIIEKQTLHLNGCGIRKKFFFSVYVGSLYTARRVSSLEEALRDPGPKLVRMSFVYSKVDREKIVEAFAEGFEKNTPGLSDSGAVKTFLNLFDSDFVEGDTVDLVLGTGGEVSVLHNGSFLGKLVSPKLVGGILAIYLGKNPADEDLREGMLGLNL